MRTRHVLYAVVALGQKGVEHKHPRHSRRDPFGGALMLTLCRWADTINANSALSIGLLAQATAATFFMRASPKADLCVDYPAMLLPSRAVCAHAVA